MDQAGIIALFDHGYWVRDRVLEAAAALPPEQWTAADPAGRRTLRDTLVHDLDTEWSWRLRLQAVAPDRWGPEAELRPTDFPSVESVAAHWRRDEIEMRQWLDSLDDATLAAEVSPPGDLRLPLWTYLLHMVLHGIQQRADAAALLSAAGASPGDLDFLDSYDRAARDAAP